jgi:sulfur carrier protein
VKVLLNHPVRELDIPGPKRVKDLLKELALLPESVLVVRGNDLVTEDDTLGDNDRVEIRPVMSGGAGEKGRVLREKSLSWQAWGWVGEMAEPG